MLDQKTFLLGVGAQKTGSTWLSDYLGSRSEVFMHPLKEVHYWDYKFRKDICGHFDQQYLKRLSSVNKKMILIVKSLRL